MIKLSITIPSRSPQYLQATIDDLLLNAEDEVEVIVVLDGYHPETPVKEDSRVRVIYQGTPEFPLGMREGINRGFRESKGEYLMTCDEHCAFDKGYDVKLIADCEDDWVVIPRRKRLEPETWTLIHDGRPDIDIMMIDYPYQRPQDKTCGLHGAEWKERQRERLHILIDDTPTMQGSCYFLKKSYWEKLFPNGLDTEKYGTFTQEAQEVSLTAWFSGGRVVVNKNTWYAHWHKGKRGKGYGFTREQYVKHLEGTEKGRLYCINHWLYTKDYKYDWDWFMAKFPDMPGWGDDWKERIEQDRHHDYSTLTETNDWYGRHSK